MGDIVEQERRVKRLKRAVESWRVVLLELREVLMWERPWHPALMFGVLTTAHLLLWLLEPNTLTLLASLGILLNLVDFLVPMAAAQLMPQTPWTGQQEKQLDDICRRVVFFYNIIAVNVAAFYSMRQTKPLMYYILSVSVLFLVLWLGKSVNNSHLFYLLTVAVCLSPGLIKRGFPQKLSYALRGTVTVKKEN